MAIRRGKVRRGKRRSQRLDVDPKKLSKEGKRERENGRLNEDQKRENQRNQ